MDFFPHSLLISSPSWHLDFLTTPHMGRSILSDLQDSSFTLANSTRDLPFITRRPAENGACRFQKNVIQFQLLWNKLGFVGAIFGHFLAEEGWQANHGLVQTLADKHRQHLLADLNLAPLQYVGESKVQDAKIYKMLTKGNWLILRPQINEIL